MTARHYFPLLAAGFRSNPFRALPDREWAESAVLTETARAAFRQPDAHLQVLGGLGAGKTTTLLGLERLAQDTAVQTVYLYISEGQTRLESDIPSDGLLLLDEAQRLAADELGRLLDQLARHQERNRGAHADTGLRLALASHVDLSEQFHVCGLPLITVSVDALSLDGWRAFLDARLAAAALPGRPHATLADDSLWFLAEQFGTDRRAAVAFLYEVFQALREPTIVDAAQLQSELFDEGYGQRRSSIRNGV